MVCRGLPGVAHPWWGTSTLSHCSSSFSFDGLDVELPLACPGAQSRMESRVWWRIQTKPAFVFWCSQGEDLVSQHVLLLCNVSLDLSYMKEMRNSLRRHLSSKSCILRSLSARSVHVSKPYCTVWWRLRGTCIACDDGAAFPEPAYFGHCCSRHGNAYSDVRSIVIVLGQSCSQMPKLNKVR